MASKCLTPFSKVFLRRSLSTLTYGVIRLCGRRHAGLRVLMYHRVTDAHPKERLCVSPKDFAEQVRWLHEAGYQSLTFSQAVDWIQGKAGKPKKAVVLTFDDGFEDNFIYARPVLEQYRFSGCFFIPTAFLRSQPGSHPQEDRPMSWEQLNALIRQGHEVGAHSVTHRKLARLTEPEIRHEVFESKAALDSVLSHATDFFCYPAGSYDAAVVGAVKAAGFRGACTVKPGANYPGGNPFLLNRTEIGRFDSLWDFEKKMAGAYDWLHGAVQGVHTWTRRDKECANAMSG